MSANKIQLFSVFHLNLVYSSIEEGQRPEVINQCYWPLLKLTRDYNLPIAIEASGYTLESINQIDPDWIAALRQLAAEGRCEFVGSGYAQIIGPLVPAMVNEWNQRLGIEVYEKLLGIKPNIALINEMAYSAGMVEHYVNAGYNAIIMEWNNPRHSHPEWENEWRYYPQRTLGAENTSIPLIWADSIAFQKFQRYAHGEYDFEDYTKYLESQVGEESRYFPLYANDAEIFDYRPGRYHTEAQFDDDSEWNRILALYTFLSQQDWCEFVFPTKILSAPQNEFGGNELKLESPAQPIPVKKQEKYNINRWALTGRDDVIINTKCYKIYEGLLSDKNAKFEDWKELCYLWSSDFRTHITEKRWNEYRDRLNDFLLKWDCKKVVDDTKTIDMLDIVEDVKWIIVENNNYKVVLNKNKGLTVQDLVFKKIANESLLGTLDHGYYDDISLGADYYSGHAVIERPGEHKITDLGKVNPKTFKSNNSIIIKTNQEWSNYTFKNNVVFGNDKIIFEKIIETDTLKKSVIHPFSFTFNPEAWDKESLHIKSNNGGSSCEKFYLSGQNITHGDIYSSLISARHGFGNTEGIFIVGDKDKSINFICYMTNSALIPSIIYQEMNSTFFFRLQYSAREMDETLQISSERVNMIRSSLLINAVSQELTNTN